MARKVSSKFGVTDDLFDFSEEVQEVQEVQEVVVNLENSNNLEETRIPVTMYGSSQGKKGMKMKRINMGFPDHVHFYISHESKRRGISTSKFVNEIIEEFMKEHPYNNV